MTPTDSPTTAHSSPSADPRPLFASCVATGSQTLGGVRPDQLDLATPCDGFNVRDLLGHMTEVVYRVAALGRGENPFALAFEPAVVADDAWVQAWDAAVAEAEAAWADDAVLARTMRLPWADGPGAEILPGYVNEVTVHTWDLAKATGQHPEWDDSVLETSFEAIRQMLPAEGRAEIFGAVIKDMPEHLRTGEAPFAEAVKVPAEAPLIDRLIAYTGRQP